MSRQPPYTELGALQEAVEKLTRRVEELELVAPPPRTGPLSPTEFECELRFENLGINEQHPNT